MKYNSFKLLFLIVIFFPDLLFGQCTTDLLLGQNIVLNPNFSDGYSNWTYTADPTQINGYTPYGGGFSVPGNIYAGASADYFNSGGFDDFDDHTPNNPDNMMLMVDGICKPDIKLWQQTVSVTANTNYYFSVWIHTLKDFRPKDTLASLRFDVANQNLGNIIAPRLMSQGWIQFETVWNSTSNSGPTVISIENTTIISCDSMIDFAIDDIAFIAGCTFGSVGPQPNLGPDQTLCGKGGTIILNANIPQNSTTSVTWSDGTTGYGLSAPYTHAVTAAGTYAVCASDAGSCTKSDVIVINDTYTINIGANVDLCTISSTKLDAGFSGIGVTYQWYKNHPTLAPGISLLKTYTANSVGTYRVDVNVAGCGLRSSQMSITSNATATPVDAVYCGNGETPTLSIVGTGDYTWYDASTGGNQVATGLSYTLPAITNNPADQNYYVQDNKIYSGTAGSTNYTGADINNGYDKSLKFTIGNDIEIKSLQIPFISWYSDGDGEPGFTSTIEVVDADGNSFSPAKTFTSSTSLETVPANDGGKTHLYTFPFTGFNILASWGTTLRLKLKSSTHPNGAPMFQNSGFTYPINSTPVGFVTINSSYNGDWWNNGGLDSDGYSYFYNWSIAGKSACSRVLVRALNNCPLPVTWSSFYLKTTQTNKCQLFWTTASETNNKYFIIERTHDGIIFEKIGRLEGNGTKNTATEYSFIDNSTMVGNSYYRIVQYDKDGSSISSEILLYLNSKQESAQIELFPNPFLGQTILLVSKETKDEIKINESKFNYIVYSIQGQAIVKGIGYFDQAIDLGKEFAKGIYVLEVMVEKEKQTIKMVKN